MSVSWLTTLPPSLSESKVAQARGGAAPGAGPSHHRRPACPAPLLSHRRWVAVVMARSAPTIPIASASGKPNFTLTEQNWQKIERVYRNSLSSDVRNRILKATTSFVSFEVFERNAEPLRAAIERIQSIKKATGNLIWTLAALTGDERCMPIISLRGISMTSVFNASR